MDFFAFHLMPWPHLPDDYEKKYNSAWVWAPNDLYDPAKGHDLYNRYLDELEYAEELGFDGVCVNEHHQNSYGKMLFADPEGPLATTLIMHPDEMPEEIVLMAFKAAEATARIAWNPYFHNPKLQGRLHRIKCPTLVLWGDKDGLVPPAHGKTYASAISGAKLVMIENCGHMPPIEAQDAFVRHTTEFLKG